MIYRFDILDSTNNKMKKMLSDNDKTACLKPFDVICATRQTNGYGRKDRQFCSPEGGLYFSIYYPDKRYLPCLTLMAGFSMLAALEKAISPRFPSIKEKLSLKWPNDILLNGKKICGILIENLCAENDNRYIIGVGLNIKKQIFDKSFSYSVSSLEEEGYFADGNEIIQLFLSEMRYNISNNGWFPEMKKKSCVIGKRICYISDGEKRFGTAVDIDENGHLLVKDESSQITDVFTDEISVLLSERSSYESDILQ